MLKTESTCKPSLLQMNTKQHLLDLRHQRQKQLALTIDECHRLRVLHKRLFDRQLNSHLPEQIKSIKKDATYIINDRLELENDIPIIKESSQYLSDSSQMSLDSYLRNNRLLSAVKKPQQRCLNVASMALADKQVNKTYEKRPHLPQIFEYRTNKIPLISSRPNIETSQKKRKEPVRFVHIARQIRNSSSSKPSKKSPPIDEIKPYLPATIIDSKRLQTQQWLITNYFPLRTVPVI